MLNKLKPYSHILYGLYIFIYLPWFVALEKIDPANFHHIHCKLDDIIPFCEYFIVPYVMWFGYVAVTCAYLFFNEEKGNFRRFALALTGGMTICMLIFMIYPNYITLRPAAVDTNIFGRCVSFLYKADTSTNVFPSIHVYNSLVCCVALEKNARFNKSKINRYGNIILTILICLSTVFLKQHSVYDVIGALILYPIIYYILYHVASGKYFTNKDILLKDK